MTNTVQGIPVVRVAPFTGAWIEIVFSTPTAAWPPVAPFTGAWIEIRGTKNRTGSKRRSHPSRVRGLKSVWAAQIRQPIPVAPFTGAWIEIYVASIRPLRTTVAPFTGAWIEIML